MQSLSADFLPAGSETPAPVPAAVLDLRHLNHQTLGDPVLRAEVLQLFLAEAPKYIADLQAATDCGSWRMAVHTLKGVSLNLGAIRLAQICRQFESEEAVAAQSQKHGAAATIADMIDETRAAIGAALPQRTG